MRKRLYAKKAGSVFAVNKIGSLFNETFNLNKRAKVLKCNPLLLKNEYTIDFHTNEKNVKTKTFPPNSFKSKLDFLIGKTNKMKSALLHVARRILPFQSFK